MSESVEMTKKSIGSSSELQDEHYKSLITDDEVVAALIKDSKKREGTLEVERMKPNLNFLKRTVSSLVSNNVRIDENRDSFKTTYTKENKIELQVLQQIRLENEASTSKKPEVNFEFEKDMFLKTAAINFQKSTEQYGTVEQHNVMSISEKSTICNISESNKKTRANEKSIITKDFLKKELEKINNKIQKMSSKQIEQNISSCSNIEIVKNVPKKSGQKQNSLTKHKVISSSNMSKEDLLKHELASLNVKIQEKISKMKTKDIILILDKEEDNSNLEIVNLDSSDESTSKSNIKSKSNDKSKSGKVRILQNIEISNKESTQAAIRRRMLSRIKQNKLELQNTTNSGNDIGETLETNVFTCKKCGSCNSNDIVDTKYCTAIKCETIELSSSSSDLELVSVKVEPKAKKKKKKIQSKKAEKDKKGNKKEKHHRKRTNSRDSKSNRERTYSRGTSSSSENSRNTSWDRERDVRDKQRDETYNARKENFKSTMRDRTKSRDSRERSTSRERRANFREKDRKRSPFKERRARSVSRFSTGASYERYIKERDKSKSKSRSRSNSNSRRSGSKDSRKRDSSADSELERSQAHMLAQQRFEERARREYWMNRIIREYQNRYRIPRIPQRHRLVESRKPEPPSVQSKIVVVSKMERYSSSESNCSKSRGRSRSPSSDSSLVELGRKQDRSLDETEDIDKYNLDSLAGQNKSRENEIHANSREETVLPPSNNKESSSKSPEKLKTNPETSEKSEDSGPGRLRIDSTAVFTNIDKESSWKRLREDSNNQSFEEEENISDKNIEDKTDKKKKTTKKKKKDKDKKKEDKYMWKQVEISSNVTLHLGTECE